MATEKEIEPFFTARLFGDGGTNNKLEELLILSPNLENQKASGVKAMAGLTVTGILVQLMDIKEDGAVRAGAESLSQVSCYRPKDVQAFLDSEAKTTVHSIRTLLSQIDETFGYSNLPCNVYMVCFDRAKSRTSTGSELSFVAPPEGVDIPEGVVLDKPIRTGVIIPAVQGDDKPFVLEFPNHEDFLFALVKEGNDFKIVTWDKQQYPLLSQIKDSEEKSGLADFVKKVYRSFMANNPNRPVVE